MGLVFGGLTIPAAAALNAVAEPRGLASAGARALVPVTWGTDRVSALLLNVVKHATDPTIVLVQCLWGHACTTVDQPRLNDLALSAGTTATHYTGSQSTADATLVAAFAAQSITYSDTLAGYAYSVFGLPVREFNGQLNFSARIAGRKLYDPRKDTTNGGSGSHRLATPSTWEYSDNPSLMLADWLYSTLYGAGESVLWSSVITAANANDAMIGSPSEKHRIVGLTLTSAAEVPTVAEALRAYAGVWLVPTSGGIKLLPDADGSAAASYSHSSGQIAALDALALKDLGNVPTVVDVVYTDTSQVPYRDATATAQLSGAGTTLPWRLSSVRLPGVQRYSQAYREAVERLNKLQLNDLSTSLEVFDGGIAHEVGDIVNVTHPVGLSSKPFRVTDVDMPGPGRWRLALAEHDPAAYSTTVATAATYTNSGLAISDAPPVAWSDVTSKPADSALLNSYVATGGGNMIANPCFMDQSRAGWVTANYGLGSAALEVYDIWSGGYRLNGRETGFLVCPSAFANDAYYVEASATPMVVTAGRWYQCSAWVAQYTSGATLFIAWLDSSGAVISYSGYGGSGYSSLTAGGTASRQQPGGDPYGRVESDYAKLWATAQAPSGAVRARVTVRMFQSPGCPWSFLWFTRVQFCEVQPNCATLVAFDFGAGAFNGAAQITGDNVLAYLAPEAITKSGIGVYNGASIYSGAAVSFISTYYADGPTLTIGSSSRVFGAVSGSVSWKINTTTLRLIQPAFKLQLVRTSDGAVMDESGIFGGPQNMVRTTISYTVSTAAAAIIFDAQAAGTYKVRLKVDGWCTDDTGSFASNLVEALMYGEVSGVEFKV